MHGHALGGATGLPGVLFAPGGAGSHVSTLVAQRNAVDGAAWWCSPVSADVLTTVIVAVPARRGRGTMGLLPSLLWAPPPQPVVPSRRRRAPRCRQWSIPRPPAAHRRTPEHGSPLPSRGSCCQNGWLCSLCTQMRNDRRSTSRSPDRRGDLAGASPHELGVVRSARLAVARALAPQPLSAPTRRAVRSP